MSARDTTRPRIRVLAADDGNNLTVLNALLCAAGHQVFLASSGEECIRVARKVLPDVVLLDIDIPGMDGYEAAAALSGAEETRSIPIVMAAALTGEQDRLHALKAGAVDSLSKPMNPDLLKGKVMSLARLKAYHDDMKSQRTKLMAKVAGKSG